MQPGEDPRSINLYGDAYVMWQGRCACTRSLQPREKRGGSSQDCLPCLAQHVYPSAACFVLLQGATQAGACSRTRASPGMCCTAKGAKIGRFCPMTAPQMPRVAWILDCAQLAPLSELHGLRSLSLESPITGKTAGPGFLWTPQRGKSRPGSLLGEVTTTGWSAGPVWVMPLLLVFRMASLHWHTGVWNNARCTGTLAYGIVQGALAHWRTE